MLSNAEAEVPPRGAPLLAIPSPGRYTGLRGYAELRVISPTKIIVSATETSSTIS